MFVKDLDITPIYHEIEHSIHPQKEPSMMGIMISCLIGTFVLIWRLQQVYHLLCASCMECVHWGDTVSEGLLEKTGLFRDNQFHCDGWRTAIRGRLSAKRMCTNLSVFRLVSIWNYYTTIEPVQHSAPSSVRQKCKLNTHLSRKTSYPSVNVTLRYTLSSFNSFLC